MLASMLPVAMAVFNSAYAAKCKPHNCGDVQCYQRKPKSATFDMYTSGGKARARCEFSITSNTSKPKMMFLHRDSASLKFHSRTWREYVDGFSDKSGNRMWMGLENAHRLTIDNTMRMFVTMTGPRGYTGSIQYPGFRVYGGDPYEYSVSHQPHRHAKKSGDSFKAGYPFSALYHDGTQTKCATILKTGGWFAEDLNSDGSPIVCTEANLFGRYTRSNQSDALSWKSFNRPIHSLEMYFKSAGKPCVNLCQNGGLCIYNEKNDTDNCSCAAGFFGHKCEWIDPCIDGKSICNERRCIGNYEDGSFRCEYRKFCHLGVCKHDATCVDAGGRYTCFCSHAFKGINCSERICDDFDCHNGGTCLTDPESDSAKCECYAGYGGLHCEDRLGCWTNPCQNSGSCVNEVGEDTFRCMCPQGFSGRICDVEEGETTNQLQRLLSIIILIILGALGLVLWLYAIMYCIGAGNPRAHDVPVPPADRAGKRADSAKKNRGASVESPESSLESPEHNIPASAANTLHPPTKKLRKSLSPDTKRSESAGSKKGEHPKTRR